MGAGESLLRYRETFIALGYGDTIALAQTAAPELVLLFDAAGVAEPHQRLIAHLLKPMQRHEARGASAAEGEMSLQTVANQQQGGGGQPDVRCAVYASGRYARAGFWV
jgi:hypothetical protein